MPRKKVVLIDTLTQFLAGLEVRNIFRRHLCPRAGLWIPPDTRRPVNESKATEAASLDAITVPEGRDHRIENHIHRQIGILRQQLRKTHCQLANQFGLRHARICRVACPPLLT